MENPTAFDLSAAVQGWRQSLAQSPSFQSENLDELEAHLHDAIAGLKARGLSEEESFLIAVRRLGRTETLTQEFGKVNAAAVWRDRALWMLAGMLFLTVGWDCINGLSSALAYLGSAFTANGLVLGCIDGATRIGLFTLAVWLFWSLANGRFSGTSAVTERIARRPFTLVVGGIIGLLLLHLVPPVFQMLFARSLTPSALGQSYLVMRGFSSLIPLLQFALMVVVFVRLLLEHSAGPAARRFAIWALMLPVAMTLSLGTAHAADPQHPATMDQAMTLWRAGKKDEAVAKFLAVDFSKRPLFPSGSVLNDTEVQFMALPDAARTKLATQMNDDLKTIKELAAQTRATAKSALDSGDKTQSDQCLAQLKACGQAFNQPDSLALLKLVGKALAKMSAAPLK